jgi:uncharacterized Zn-binding protein involved in type VI secretion
MTRRPVIREGDPTDHGGVVLTGRPHTSLFGRRIACVGDLVSCPRRGHGDCAIVEGDAQWRIEGRPVALEGHKTACGAILKATVRELGRSATSA